LDEISKSLPNYESTQNCKETWFSLDNPSEREKKVTIKSLFLWAKKDNLMEYNKAILQDKKRIYTDILEIGDVTDVMMARLYYCINNNLCIYDTDNNTWYRSNKYGLWMEDKMNIWLSKSINRTLQHNIEMVYIKIIKECPDDIKKSIIKNFTKSKKFLLMNKNKIGIVNELKLLYAKKNLYKKFDNINDYLVGFDNGVVDVQTGIFRNARPDEYITCSTGYKYCPPKKEIIAELYERLKDIMPDDEELKYLLKSISFGLIGINILEEYYIYIGSGRNGKENYRIIRLNS
jgi:hypothetical protein